MEGHVQVCSVLDLRLKGSFGFTVENIEGFVVSAASDDGDKIYAYHNACPHIGMNLEFTEHQFLDPDKQFIQCAMHGALFELNNGKCVHGPCLNQHLKPLNARIIDDHVWIGIK